MLEPHSHAIALLIVDDDVRILEIAEHSARQTGLFGQIATASNGRIALAQVLVSEEPPDVILTDLSMPQMDGFEFTQAIKQLPATKHIPVVMFSSSGLLYDQQHAIEAGCAAFFPKPATMGGMNEVLREVAKIATQVAAH